MLSKNKNTSRLNNLGFTLVELLITIVVIGILAGIAIVAYNGLQVRAQNTAVLHAVKEYQKALELYAIENQSYPGFITNSNRDHKCLGSLEDYPADDIFAAGQCMKLGSRSYGAVVIPEDRGVFKSVSGLPSPRIKTHTWYDEWDETQVWLRGPFLYSWGPHPTIPSGAVINYPIRGVQDCPIGDKVDSIHAWTFKSEGQDIIMCEIWRSIE